jgi:biopolymer transport protein ExbD
MSEGVKEENQLYDEINITPMLDLAYVLLVIFIIMTTASVQGVKVDTPQTTNSAPLAKPQMRAITVTSDGAIYLDAYPVDMASLEQRLAEFKSGNPDLPVVLKADAAAHYEKVSEVLEICKKLDITEVGLITKKVTE